MNAQQIIRSACMRFAVSVEDFLDSSQRDGPASDARYVAIIKLREVFSRKQVARLLNVSPSTIDYHTAAHRSLARAEGRA